MAASDDLYFKCLELGIAGHDSNIIVSPHNRILGTRSRKYYYRKLIYILYLARKISPILKLGWERLVTSDPNTSHILDVALPVFSIKQVSFILSFILLILSLLFYSSLHLLIIKWQENDPSELQGFIRPEDRFPDEQNEESQVKITALEERISSLEAESSNILVKLQNLETAFKNSGTR